MKSTGFIVWFTGLSGAGKSTLASRLSDELGRLGRPAEVLDGDEVRSFLSKGLGFSKDDRDTHLRRVGYVARLLARHGTPVIVAAISPYRAIRDELRQQFPDFVEVYARCSLEELVRRDVKGLYQKALAGEIKQFTGITDPYQPPIHPDVVVDTDRCTVQDGVDRILSVLERLDYVTPRRPLALPIGEARQALVAEAHRLPRLNVSRRDFADAYMLSAGAFSPLEGFMNHAEYTSVVDDGRLPNGHPFPIPVVLRVTSEDSRMVMKARRVAAWQEETPIAIIDVHGTYCIDPEREAASVYGTRDPAHPGVRLLLSAERWVVAGDVTCLTRPQSPSPDIDRSPYEVRQEAQRRGWQTMVGFQTRNPVHRAHEYLQKVCLETIDGLLLHPIMGETKADDIEACVRLECYRTLINNYYPVDRVLLVSNPAWMRYAGPKEAVFHAIVRRNYGCTHFIVGRDHAGVGQYYDSRAAQRIFDQYEPGELGIQILPFDNAFYCRHCRSMATAKTCPHPEEEHLSLSGTTVRAMLMRGEPIPDELTRPEVAQVLSRAIQHRRAPAASLKAVG